MIRRLLSLFLRPARDTLSAQIASRAMRLHNRQREAANRYIAVHEALRRGK